MKYSLFIVQTNFRIILSVQWSTLQISTVEVQVLPASFFPLYFICSFDTILTCCKYKICRFYSSWRPKIQWDYKKNGMHVKPVLLTVKIFTMYWQALVVSLGPIFEKSVIALCQLKKHKVYQSSFSEVLVLKTTYQNQFSLFLQNLKCQCIFFKWDCGLNLKENQGWWIENLLI